MQKTRAWLKRLVFTGQLTLIGMMMFGVLKIFFECYEGKYPHYREVPEYCSE
tara:strand:+ start:198 stop:353 length:156 start_codon:yes stop_codon:yes gene_type:complete